MSFIDKISGLKETEINERWKDSADVNIQIRKRKQSELEARYKTLRAIVINSMRRQVDTIEQKLDLLILELIPILPKK